MYVLVHTVRMCVRTGHAMSRRETHQQLRLHTTTKIMSPTSPPLSEVLPPLICGTATFTSQYNTDPYALSTTDIIHRSLALGLRAFDTSPYYGPAEELIGTALDTPFVQQKFTRRDYFLLTKVGRISNSEFDYSASWVRQSVKNSLKRLRSDYLDVVYCHDVEFVTPQEVLTAVTELRKIRDESGLVKYIGISGYPVETLCELAELIFAKTGEPLDVVMSYANFTLQNKRLASLALPRLKAAGVSVVPNGSILGMGLLRRVGVPIGAQGDFHPSPKGLRIAIKGASDWCDSQGERIERVALRWGLETWLQEGKPGGSKGDPPCRILHSVAGVDSPKLGASVIGVSTVDELEETMLMWRDILDGLEYYEQNSAGSSDTYLKSRSRKVEVQRLADGIRQRLGTWADYTWASPEPGFVNKPKSLSP